MLLKARCYVVGSTHDAGWRAGYVPDAEGVSAGRAACLGRV